MDAVSPTITSQRLHMKCFSTIPLTETGLFGQWLTQHTQSIYNIPSSIPHCPCTGARRDRTGCSHLAHIIAGAGGCRLADGDVEKTNQR